MKELKETIDLMTSDNYKERFVAEYQQLMIRYRKLRKFVKKIELNRSNVNSDCPISLLKQQLDTMGVYLDILENRAILENIDLD